MTDEPEDNPSNISTPAISLHINTVFGILDNWLTDNNLYTSEVIHWRVTWDANGYPVTLMGFDDENIIKLDGDGG